VLVFRISVALVAGLRPAPGQPGAGVPAARFVRGGVEA
jgi:hypothetical protein